MDPTLKYELDALASRCQDEFYDVLNNTLPPDEDLDDNIAAAGAYFYTALMAEFKEHGPESGQLRHGYAGGPDSGAVESLSRQLLNKLMN